MTTNFPGSPQNSGSAKIFTFPARGRFAAAGQPKQPANVQLPSGVKVASGSGWYHEAAIQDSIKAAPYVLK
jgi:hypothetical protein